MIKSKQTSKPAPSKEKPNQEIEIVDSLALVISCKDYEKCVYESVSQSKRDSPIVTIEEAH